MTAAAAPPTSPRTPPVFDAGTIVAERFRIDAFRGMGAFGSVYRAHDTRLARDVALKVLIPGAVTSERFQRETMALAALNHPSIVTIYDAGRSNGYAWIAMEFVDGETLEERLRHGPIPWDELARVFQEVAAALEHAHQRGIIHRDVKPGNIFLSRSGRVKVGDFGIARALEGSPVTERGIVFGTMEYMAPEVLAECDPDPRIDIYSMGVCLYQGLTGRVPISGETPQQLMHRVMEIQPERISAHCPDLPSDLHRLVDSCLEKDPARRPRNAREVQMSMRHLLKPLTGGASRSLALQVPPRLSTGSLTPEVNGERKRVVLLAARERHVPELLEELPADVLQQIRSSYMEGVFEIIEKHAGLMDQIEVDEFLVLFGLPRASEDDEDRALRCAAEMRDLLTDFPTEFDRPLRLSVGVQPGHAITSPGTDRFILDGVCARQARGLAEAAEEGEILVGSEVTDRLAGRYEFIPSRKITLPGMRQPTRPHRLGPPKVSSPIRPRPGEWGTTGRDSELAFLAAAARRAFDGTGQIVSVTGEAGIGKTHLLNAFLSRPPISPGTKGIEGPAILSLSGQSAAGQLPHRSAADLVETLLGGVGGDSTRESMDRAGLDAGERRAVWNLLNREEGGSLSDKLEDRCLLFTRTIRRLLLAASRERGLVLVQEDLHWFDRPSLEVVKEVFSDLHGLPVLVLNTWRSGFDPGLGGLREHQAVSLGPLRPEDDLEIARRFLGIDRVPGPLQSLLEERSEGNPLYLLELIRMLLERNLLRKRNGSVDLAESPSESDVPATIEGILAARVDRLEPDTRKLLQIAAVLGREFPARLLDEVSPNQPDRESLLQALSRRGILHATGGPDGPGIRFDHTLTRDVVYANTLRGSRREYHRLAAEAIHRLHPEKTGDHLDRIAYHWSRSDDLARAVAALREAGERHVLRSRYEAAIQQYDCAIDLAGDDREMLFPLLQARCEVRSTVSRYREAREDADRLIALAGEDPDLLFHAELGLAKALEHQGRLSEAEEVMERCVRKAAGDEGRVFESVTFQAYVAHRMGRSSEAVRMLDGAVALQRKVTDPRILAMFHDLRGILLYEAGDLEGALVQFELALSMCEQAGQGNRAAWILYQHGTVLVGKGRYAQGLEKLRRAAEEARKLGCFKILADVLWSTGYAHLQQGRLDGIQQVIQELRDCPDDSADSICHPLRLQGVLDLWQGRFASALENLDRCVELHVTSGDLRSARDCNLEMSRVHLENGDPGQALDLAERVGQEARKAEDPFQTCEAAVVTSAALMALGQGRRAAEEADRALEIARRFNEPESLVPALLQASRLRSGEEARALVEEALALARDAGRRLDIVMALLRRGEIQVEQGNLDAAARDAESAAERSHRLRAHRLATHAARLLGRAKRRTDVEESPAETRCGPGTK